MERALDPAEWHSRGRVGLGPVELATHARERHGFNVGWLNSPDLPALHYQDHMILGGDHQHEGIPQDLSSAADRLAQEVLDVIDEALARENSED